jgi:dTDP-4-amino-4,6-dideoxygalactose transaminase
MGFSAGYCPEAEQYYSEAISIPLFPALTETQQDKVVEALADALSCVAL